jgi:hypothetical protein
MTCYQFIMTHWIHLCLTLKRLFPSMFDGDFDPKQLCLTWLVDYCVYDLALEVVSLTLVVCCCRCCFVVVAIARCNVLQNEPHVHVHERLIDNICCCCSSVVIVVTIAQCDMMVSCSPAQGLIVC